MIISLLNQWWKITPRSQAKLKPQRHPTFPSGTNTWNSDVKHRKSECSCFTAVPWLYFPSTPGWRTEESVDQLSWCFHMALVSQTVFLLMSFFVSSARDVTAPPTRVLVWSLRAVDSRSRRELVLGGDLTALSGSGLSLFVFWGGRCVREVGYRFKHAHLAQPER